MDNPYVAPVALENEHVTTTEVLDPATGARTVIAGTKMSVIIDANGGRHVAQQDVRVRSSDGRLLGPTEQVYRCACGCTDLLSHHSVRFCTACQAPVHAAHLKTWNNGTTSATVCPSCWTPGHGLRALKRFLTWLLHL